MSRSLNLATAAFRVGDRVRATRPSWGDEHAPVGAIGSVEDCPNHPGVLTTLFDGYPGADNGDGTRSGWAMFPGQVEHVHGPATRTLRRVAWAARNRRLPH